MSENLKLEKYTEPDYDLTTVRSARTERMDIIFGSMRFRLDIINKMKPHLSREVFEWAFIDAIENTANCIRDLTIE